jgi:hypothetical protein
MLYGKDPGYAIGELEKVLGRLPDRVKHDYMGEQSRTHGDLTELLMSRASPVVADQVTGLLLKSYVSPITNFLMPIRQLGPYESINFKWMEINFDEGLAPQVEVEGLARLYTHNKTRRGARMVRRGVAVKVEEGFFLTPEGRREWAMQIEQLAAIIQRTNEYDAFMTLLQTPLRENVHANELGGAYNHIYGARDGMSRYDRLMLQRDWFGIVNKAEDSRGFNNCVTQLRTTMIKQGVEPNAIVVPPNLISSYYNSSDDLWNYNTAGPQALKNRSEGEDVGPENGIRTRSFQGLKVVDTYVQRSTVGGHEGPGDLLTVPVQIGEFYPMSTDLFLEDEDEIFSFRGKKRDIRIFNEDQSRIVNVSFEDAIANCLRWDKLTGKLDEGNHLAAHDDIFLMKDGNVVDKWIDVETDWWGEGGIAARRVAQSILSKYTKQERDRLDTYVRKVYTLHLPSTFDVSSNEQFPSRIVPTVPDGAATIDQQDRARFAAALSAYSDTFWEAIGQAVDRVNKNIPGDTSHMSHTQLKDFVANNFNVDVPNDTEKSAFWNKVMSSLRPIEKVVLMAFLNVAIEKEACRQLHRADVYLPFDFVLARPYMTYYASSVIMMLAGRETGEIVVGQQRFQMTSNIGDRTLYANYFYYGKAVVYKDRNVIVAPNVFIQDYAKGNNTSFITDEDLSEIHESGGLFERTNSILALLTKASDKTFTSNVLDIRGRNAELEIPGRSRTENHYATSGYYDHLFNIDPLGVADPMSDYFDYEDLNMQANTICFLGHTEDWRGKVLFHNTGHLGPHTYDQCNLSRKPGHYSPIRGTQGALQAKA